jgi:hypothetical protein
VLSREQFDACLDAQFKAGLTLAAGGNIEASMKLIAASTSLAWEITRPGAQMLTVDLTDRLDDDLRAIVKRYSMNVVIDEDDVPLMGFAEGGGEPTPEMMKFLLKLGDDAMSEHFPHLDMSAVTKLDDLMVETTRDTIDQQVEDFREEFDSLFETWGGGETT